MTDTTKHDIKKKQSLSRVLTTAGLASYLLLISPFATALEFRCEASGDIRYLRVDIPGKQHLCEVSVKYEYTGEHRVIWNAQNDSLFCSARAYELRDKYEDKWNFNCTTWPDRDGIDKLSASQRSILDKQLISLIKQGQDATPRFTVNAVKAVASTPLDNSAGTLALQFFLSGGDLTQIIVDNTRSWNVFATFEDLAAHIDSESPPATALVDAITDGGALSINTTMDDGNDQRCHGNQVLLVKPDNQLSPRSAHRTVCEPELSLVTESD